MAHHTGTLTAVMVGYIMGRGVPTTALEVRGYHYQQPSFISKTGKTKTTMQGLLVRSTVRVSLAVLAGWAALAASGEGTEVLEVGPLSIEIHISPTAHAFHIVDQLADWSPFCHQQYRDYFSNLSARDIELLEEHAQVRRAKSWGQGLEQTFYSDLTILEALREGVDSGLLTQSQADIEARVLGHFGERAATLMRQDMENLKRFVTQLHEKNDDLVRFSEKAGRFCRTPELSVPVYLIASPDNFSSGGGYNGGRLTIEVPRKGSAFNVFLHEIMHAFMREQEALLKDAADSCPGLDLEKLNEGIAYALSPGMLHNQGSDADPLMTRVASDIEAKKGLDDPYVCSNRYGLALRPLLRTALDDEDCDLAEFLPAATDAWLVMTELTGALGGNKTSTKWIGKESSGRTVFVMAPAGAAVYKAVRQTWQGNAWGRPHEEEFYQELFELHAKPGDVIVLAFSLDSPERVSQAFEHLLPDSWPSIETALKEGKSVELDGRYQDMGVKLVAAPTRGALLELVTSMELK